MTWTSLPCGWSARTSSRKAAKVLPLFGFRKLRFNLAGADFESGKQIQRPMTLVSALQPPHYFTAVGLHITRGPLDSLYARFFVHAQHDGVHRRVLLQTPPPPRLWRKIFLWSHAP